MKRYTKIVAGITTIVLFVVYLVVNNSVYLQNHCSSKDSYFVVRSENSSIFSHLMWLWAEREYSFAADGIRLNDGAIETALPFERVEEVHISQNAYGYSLRILTSAGEYLDFGNYEKSCMDGLSHFLRSEAPEVNIVKIIE